MGAGFGQSGFFFVNGGVGKSSSREDKRSVRVAVDRCFPQSQADTWSRQSLRRHAAMGAEGISVCQGTPWGEELYGKELHGVAGGDLESRESAVSRTSSIQR